MNEAAPEREESLWILVAPPSIWGAHFLLSYVAAAIYCAKSAGPETTLEPIRITIAILTVVALAGIGFIGWFGFQRHREGAETPHDEDTPMSRRRFLGFATLLLSALSAIATIYVALAAVFLETCR